MDGCVVTVTLDDVVLVVEEVVVVVVVMIAGMALFTSLEKVLSLLEVSTAVIEK